MSYRTRFALRLVLAVTIGLLAVSGAVGLGGSARPAGATTSGPAANADWTNCNATAVSSAPAAVWVRIRQATQANKGLPASFWSNVSYRDDLARIICYESSFEAHAADSGQYGWYQMSQGLIASEQVTWDEYWHGSKAERMGWYQCLAGERYVAARYGTPAVAWQHEGTYGWY